MAGSNDFTDQNIQDTYQRVLQLSSSGQLADGTGSLVSLLETTSSFATNAVTASHALFAVSASHEIVKEVSSSHANTADVANGLQDIPVNSSGRSYYINYIDHFLILFYLYPLLFHKVFPYLLKYLVLV